MAEAPSAQVARVPQMEPGPFIGMSVQVRSVEFVDEHFAGEELRPGEDVPAENLSPGVAEEDMDVDEWLAVAHAHVPVEVEDFHSPGELDRVICLRELIVVRHSRVRRGPEGLDAAEPVPWLLHVVFAVITVVLVLLVALDVRP